MTTTPDVAPTRRTPVPPSTAGAVRLIAPGRLDLQPIADPAPAAGEVLVAITAVGLCAGKVWLAP